MQAHTHAHHTTHHTHTHTHTLQQHTHKQKYAPTHSQGADVPGRTLTQTLTHMHTSTYRTVLICQWAVWAASFFMSHPGSVTNGLTPLGFIRSTEPDRVKIWAEHTGHTILELPSQISASHHHHLCLWVYNPIMASPLHKWNGFDWPQGNNDHRPWHLLPALLSVIWLDRSLCTRLWKYSFWT
jgi:hypothetical protein